MTTSRSYPLRFEIPTPQPSTHVDDAAHPQGPVSFFNRECSKKTQTLVNLRFKRRRGRHQRYTTEDNLFLSEVLERRIGFTTCGWDFRFASLVGPCSGDICARRRFISCLSDADCHKRLHISTTYQQHLLLQGGSVLCKKFVCCRRGSQ
jgi:hypothetical protein